ncbi:MAG: glycoside/pentoside/hexuronide:cation symporter GPH family [Anaerolineaceae bacterium]|nr:MAG: glycoside/pentoside/hexuronide:cation symporter GPH family [Anaerolineaceae bacterium]
MGSKTSGIKAKALSFWVKLVYGSGDWSGSSYGTLRQIFYAIFLTDVVGLEPRLASVAALVSIFWDAVNDPLIGVLTDRMRSRWGRRRPFLLFFAIPFGLSFMLLWWAPPWESQIALAVTVTLAFMVSDTLETLVGVPFASLLPELTPDYDERTTLTSFRMFFNLLASLATAVAAPMIVDAALAAGLTQQQGYLLVAGLFGGLAALPFLLIFAVVRERYGAADRPQETVTFRQTVRTAWANIPFRFATLIFMLNWITFDIVALALPFYLLYWIAAGNMLASVTLLGVSLPLESAVFAILLVTAIIALPFWLWLAHRTGKHTAYIIGMVFWAGVQLAIFSVRPGQVTLVLWMSFLAGLSVSAAHILPDAMFPDVIEWDELRTGRRQEGIYYGVKNFIRKTSGALAIFLGLQALGWFNYQTPPEGVTTFTQPPETLTAIRMLIGPLGAALLFSAVITTWFYPLTRDRHTRIRKLLEKRNGRRESAPPINLP